MKKRKILMTSEASFILSGYGTYTREVFNRLHKTDKYELAELASYGRVNDQRDRSIKWLYYANEVDSKDPRHAEYKSRPSNQYGEWRFERTLLDFKPDFVWDIRDYWMSAYQKESPLRKFYNWVIMPTVDSAPQEDEWIDTFINADGVFTYSDYGLDVLRKQGSGMIKLYKSAPPGVNLSEFKPVLNKIEHRKRMGFMDDIYVVGTIMRNQKRKLYPDLMEAFKIYLQKCRNEGRKDLADKSYLYIHTSYPDLLGWNIPRLIKEYGLGNKTIFTYDCLNCKHPFAAFFQDARTVCPHCGAAAAMLPSVSHGATSQQLADIINLFDVYVQYAICEGFGMPQVEAAACGVPVMAVDYSAMSDVVRKLKGYPIRVERMFREIESHAFRAMPDNSDLANHLFKFLSLPDSIRRKKGFEARQGVEKHYTWDNTTKIWEDYFDNAELIGAQGKWETEPIELLDLSVLQNIPQNLSNKEFVEWLYVNVLKEPDDVNSFKALNMTRFLNYGAIPVHGGINTYSRQNVLDVVEQMAKNRIHAELGRCNKIQLSDEDFIHYAHLKAEQL